MRVVDTCDEWTKGQELEASVESVLNAVKGELLALARQQVSGERHSMDTFFIYMF